jgi:hypothetical protein
LSNHVLSNYVLPNHVLPNRSLSVQARTTAYGCPPIPAAFGQDGVAANMESPIAPETGVQIAVAESRV